ncbi:DUF1080 domain-containing protein [Solirubrobacter phytolaccae]|uniref:DUF1080 domain-containing protein n=1 Tax=Solirubrobacter phytolaccae TaxID=1404360 RepID=A0A9X3NAF2_9ACTN|nr:DUF1080 domain-containing protein [Solirubrobacter phytolaccae]MDA0180431.1 DUF1080 domain-containing protein [Solirubrobacter phytolaccae]
MLVEAAVALACAGAPREPDRGYRMAFDGTAQSLRRWQQAGPGSFELTSKCRLRSRGGMGLLWWDRKLRRPYTVRATWRMVGDSNSGVFIGFPRAGDDPQVAITRGYEVQIDRTDVPENTTGALYGVQAPEVARRDRALRDGWNTFDITVGRRVVVRLNGVVVNTLVAPDPARVGGGYFGLQNHGDSDVVEYRDVQIRT